MVIMIVLGTQNLTRILKNLQVDTTIGDEKTLNNVEEISDFVIRQCRQGLFSILWPNICQIK